MNLIPAFIYRRVAHRPNLVKILDNIGWLFFDKVLRLVVGLIIGVWVARYLGPEQFGILSYAIAFVGLFGAIAGLGLQSILVREIVRDPNSKEETLGTAAFLQLISGLITYGIILIAIYWLRPEDMLAKALVAILGSMMLFKASEVAVFWFESQVQSKYTVWVQNIAFLFFAVIKMGLILYQAPLVAFAWAMMAEALLVALLMFSVLGLRGPKLQKLRISVVRAKLLLNNSWPLMLSGIAIMIYLKIDQIMLGNMVGDEAVGIYSVAVRISELWYFIPMIILASVFPTVLELKKRSEKQYNQRFQSLYVLMVWLSVGVAVPMTFLSEPIVTLFFGDMYVQSGVVLAIHIWASVFVFLGVASGKWYLTEGLQVIMLQRDLLGGASNILLNLVLIPRYGAVGAAVATVISYALADLFFDCLYSRTRHVFKMKMRALLLFGAS